MKLAHPNFLGPTAAEVDREEEVRKLVPMARVRMNGTIAGRFGGWRAHFRHDAETGSWHCCVSTPDPEIACRAEAATPADAFALACARAKLKVERVAALAKDLP